MSAPLLWIMIPAVVGALALFVNHQRILSLVGGSLALILALIAWTIPIDQALQVGTFSLKIAPDIQVLGRRLILIPADGPTGRSLCGFLAAR